MHARASDLAMAERHAAEGEARVSRQRQIVLKMDQDHHLAAAVMARAAAQPVIPTFQKQGHASGV
jgi:hypothetical protein